MNAQDTSQAQVICRTVAEVLASNPGIKVVIVFGSAASGKLRPDSDVDVAVLFENPLNVDTRLALQEKLEDALHREVDLVDLHGLGGEILHQILTKGLVVIKNEKHAFFCILQRMIYNEEDFMPQVRRTLRARVERFAYG